MGFAFPELRAITSQSRAAAKSDFGSCHFRLDLRQTALRDPERPNEKNTDFDWRRISTRFVNRPVKSLKLMHWPAHRDLVAPALYQQILRRERHAFVKEKVGLEALARRLGREFYYETNDILSSSLTNFDDAAGGWRETLPTIFTTALELDGQLLIWGKMIKVIWPQFGEVADPVKMAIEGTPAGTQGLKVLATLFPAIIEVGMDPMSTSETHIQEALILRSLVLPQKFYGQLTIAESKRPEAPWDWDTSDCREGIK